jgi:hypothetical protein
MDGYYDKNAYNIIRLIIFDKDIVNGETELFNRSALSCEGYNLRRFIDETSIFRAALSSILLPQEAEKLDKVIVGEKIWEAYCSELLTYLGDKQYKDFVDKVEKRKAAYLNIWGNKDFLHKLPHVYLGFVYSEMPCYLLADFDLNNIPTLRISVYVEVQHRLFGLVKGLHAFWRENINAAPDNL